ncbi:hypothetical protein Syun_003810 [Stephania yunnanensis]|uniref:Uncharacterized protein n=1 Tax=Stephania yunnanensis TaxID=152371 RepID=A0AAP0Q0K2_9MAGN
MRHKTSFKQLYRQHGSMWVPPSCLEVRASSFFNVKHQEHFKRHRFISFSSNCHQTTKNINKKINK